jgi:hypothetical protein
MSSQKKAFSSAFMAIGLLAVLMVGFYYFKDRFLASREGLDLGQEAPKSEKAEFVGTYSPTDGPLVANGKRISFFTVNRRDEGGYLGSTKVDTVGSDESAYFNCVDVRIEEKDFFLNCQNPTEGTITLSGTWGNEGGSVLVRGKVIWQKNGESLIDQDRSFQLLP